MKWSYLPSHSSAAINVVVNHDFEHALVLVYSIKEKMADLESENAVLLTC